MDKLFGGRLSRDSKKKREDAGALDNSDMTGAPEPFQGPPPVKNGRDLIRKVQGDKRSKKKGSDAEPATFIPQNPSDQYNLSPDLGTQDSVGFNAYSTQDSTVRTSQQGQHQASPPQGNDSWLGRFEDYQSYYNGEDSHDDEAESGTQEVSTQPNIPELESSSPSQSSGSRAMMRQSQHTSGVPSTYRTTPRPSSTQPEVDPSASIAARVAVRRVTSPAPNNNIPPRVPISNTRRGTSGHVASTQERDFKPYSPHNHATVGGTSQHHSIVPPALVPGQRHLGQNGDTGTMNGFTAPYAPANTTESQHDLGYTANAAQSDAPEPQARRLPLLNGNRAPTREQHSPDLKTEDNPLQAEEDKLREWWGGIKTKNQQAIAKKEQEITLLKGEIQELHDNLKNEKQAARIAAQTAKSTLDATKQQHREELLKKQQESRESVQLSEKRMAELRAEHTRETQRLNNAAYKQQQEMQREQSKLNQQHAQEVANLKDEATQRENKLKHNITVLTETYDTELATMTSKHTETVTAMTNQHTEKVTAMTAQHKEEKERMRIEHEEKLQQAIKEYASDVDRLNLRIASYSLSNYKAIPDRDLGSTFQSVSQGVINLSRSIQPDGYIVDAALDPTDFLGRSGNQRSRSWPRFIKNICWETLARGFFSYPVGLGALGGDGRGHDAIYPYYEVWANRKDGAPHASPDKEASSSKAWLLSKIRDGARGVRSWDEQASYQMQFVTMFEENVESVTRALAEVLERVGGRKLNPESMREVTSISRQTGLLALDMGSQRAQLILDCCAHEQWVVLGAGFESEIPQAGQEKAQVDLMTQPCLKRVGDGHEDLTTEKVIVPGQFVPIRSGPM